MTDGLIPPLNAPPAGAQVVGTQPGTTGPVIAPFVIIFGPTGAISGIFEYAPGTTPGLGNPPIVAITAASTDPYGNAVPGGTVPRVVVQAAGGTGPYALLTSNDGFGQVGLLFPSREALEELSAEINLQIINDGLASERLVNNLNGPMTTGSPDRVDIGLASGANDGSFPAAIFLEYDDTSGNGYENMILTNTGTFIMAVSGMTAQQPGKLVPTSETWHNISLASGLTGTLRVKMASESNFAIYDVNVNFSFTASAQTFTNGSAPSSTYYPSGTQRIYSAAVNGTPSGIASTVPRLFIPAGSGAIQVIVPSGTGSSAEFCGTFWVPNN